MITGTGDAFSAGPLADPTAPPSVGPTADVSSIIEEVRELVYGAIDCDKPVACAINGVVRGSALTFALLADVIVIERHVVLADTHVLAALTAGDGGVLTWPLAIGLVRAKRYLLTGDPMSAEDAQRLGLVTEIVEQGQSKARARRYAERWASGPQTALRTTKRALNQWLRHGAVTAFDLSLASELLTLKSEEAAQTVERLMRGGKGAIERDQ
jgi:enoyl-CoA hydratase